nr:hypothetical protein [Nonomuraea solani]
MSTRETVAAETPAWRATSWILSLEIDYSPLGNGRRSATGASPNGRCGRVWYKYATEEKPSERLLAWPCSIVTLMDSLKVIGASMWKR